MHWSDLERRQPRLAARVHARLIDLGVLVMVTTRADGTPRRSAAEPLLLDRRLLLCVRSPSPEADDLRREPELVLEGIESAGGWGAEGVVTVRGRARPETDVDVQRAVAATVGEKLGPRPEVGTFDLLEVDIAQVRSVRFRDGDNRLVATWPPAVEYVRRARSAAGVAERIAVVDLLDPE